MPGLNIDPEVLDSAMRKKGLGLGDTSGVDLNTPESTPAQESAPKKKGMSVLEILARGSPNYAKNQALRTQSEIAKRQQSIAELDKKFDIAGKIATTAKTLKGEERDKFIEASSSIVGELFPDASDLAKSLIRDPEALTDLMENVGKKPSFGNIFKAMNEYDTTGKTALEFAAQQSLASAKGSTRKKTIQDFAVPILQKVENARMAGQENPTDALSEADWAQLDLAFKTQGVDALTLNAIRDLQKQRKKKDKEKQYTSAEEVKKDYLAGLLTREEAKKKIEALQKSK